MHDCLDEILECPVTKEPLRVLTTEDLERLNQQIAAGTLRHLGGSAVERAISAGFISAGGQLVYRYEDGIAFLLVQLAMVAGDIAEVPVPDELLRKETLDVQGFYAQVGWKKNRDGKYLDEQKFVDGRAVARDYLEKCQLRVGRHLPPAGRTILDAGCGPIPNPEALHSQGDFETRICTDVSLRALQNARESLGDRGVYLLCDNTRLPIRSEAVDAAVCLHNIYHIPKDRQLTAVEEIARVLRPEASAVIAYTWGDGSLVMRLSMLPVDLAKAVLRRPYRAGRRALAAFRARVGRTGGGDGAVDLEAMEAVAPTLYFHAHGYEHFARHAWDAQLHVTVLRSVGQRFTELYIHPWLMGRRVLEVIYRLEEAYPEAAGRLGLYPLLVLRKSRRS